MPQNDTGKVAVRIYRLIEFMLEHQDENGVLQSDIFENVYGNKRSERRKRGAFADDRKSVQEMFKEDHFVKVQKNGKDVRPVRWRYEGSWTILDLKNRKDALVLLIGLRLARGFMYASDDAVDRLSRRIIAALPEKVRKDAEALTKGMELEQDILGITGDDRKNDVPDKWLDELLAAIREKRYLKISVEGPYESFKDVFRPQKVYFANHDWYVVGLRVPNPKDLSVEKAIVQIVRLSRIRNIEPCSQQILPPYAASFGLRGEQLDKVMRAVFQGMFKFSLSDVMSDVFPPVTEVRLKFFGAFADSAQRARLLFGEKSKTRLEPETIDGKTQETVLEYVADTSVLNDVEPDLTRDYPLKMTVFKAPDQVVVCGPRSLQEQTIAMAEGLIHRTKAEMKKQDAAVR